MLTPEQEQQLQSAIAALHASNQEQGIPDSPNMRGEVISQLHLDRPKASLLLTTSGNPYKSNQAGYTGTNYTGDGGEGDQQFSDILAQAKQYDPNAHIDQNGQLVFDRTKLPKNPFGDLSQFSKNGTGNVLDYYSPVTGGKGVGGAELIDPTKVIDGGDYGSYTSRANLKQAPGDSDSGFMGQLGKYAPTAIAAIMSAGYGAAAGPLMGALLSGTIGPNGIGQKLAMGDKMDWGKMALNMGTSALTGWAGGQLGDITNGLTGNLDPWAQTLAKQGVNAGVGAAGRAITGQGTNGGDFAKNFAEQYAASLIPGGNTALQAYNMYKSINP